MSGLSTSGAADGVVAATPNAKLAPTGFWRHPADQKGTLRRHRRPDTTLKHDVPRPTGARHIDEA